MGNNEFIATCFFFFSACILNAYLPGAGNSSGREHYVYVIMEMKMREFTRK